MTGRFIGRSANERMVERHRQSQCGKDLFGLRHDFRTDTVTGQQQDLHYVALSCLASRLDSDGASRNRPAQPIDQTRPHGQQFAVASVEQVAVDKMASDS